MEAMPPPGAEGAKVVAADATPVLDREGRIKPRSLLAAVEPLPAAAPVAAEPAPAAPHKVASDAGAVAIPARQGAACPALEKDAAIERARHALAELRDARAEREYRVDQTHGHPRPLSKRKAKRARRNLARRRIALDHR
jgi:hypothetical protein